MITHINRFLNINLPLSSWSTLFHDHGISYMYVVFLFANVLFHIFGFIFINDIDLQFSLTCYYQLYASFIKWIKVFPPFSIPGQYYSIKILCSSSISRNLLLKHKGSDINFASSHSKGWKSHSKGWKSHPFSGFSWYIQIFSLVSFHGWWSESKDTINGLLVFVFFAVWLCSSSHKNVNSLSLCLKSWLTL